MSNRMPKVNELVRQTLGEILTKELSLKLGVFATIARVDTMSDLRTTRVYLGVYPEKEKQYVMVAMKKENATIQKKLNEKLQMKIVPKIQWFYDDTEARADEVERLIDRAKNEWEQSSQKDDLKKEREE
ncbi:MAG: ribosome-binding factor A [Candidatus Moranbacteria bacterium]|nr:ribosome-binding factor A [Candidatus Moranbacteria bacterium]